jgi:hypothetical protein
MRKHSFLPIFSDEQSRLLLRIRKEQPRTLPVAANVDGTIGAAQAGDGQPERAREPPR